MRLVHGEGHHHPHTRTDKEFSKPHTLVHRNSFHRSLAAQYHPIGLDDFRRVARSTASAPHERPALLLRDLQGGHAHARRQASLGEQRRAFHCQRHEGAGGGAGSCSTGCGSARNATRPCRVRRDVAHEVPSCTIGSSTAGRPWASSAASSPATLAEPSTSSTSSDNPATARRPFRREGSSLRARRRGESSSRHGRTDSGDRGRPVEPFHPDVSGERFGDETSVDGSRALVVRRARRRGVNFLLLEGGGDVRRGECTDATAGVVGPALAMASTAAVTLSVSGDISEAALVRRPRLKRLFDDRSANGCGSSTERLVSAILYGALGGDEAATKTNRTCSDSV